MDLGRSKIFFLFFFFFFPNLFTLIFSNKTRVYHATYCKTATTIDNTLASLSAHRMTKIYKVDELEGAAASKKEWFRLVRSVIFPTNEEEEGEDKTILSVKPGNFTGIIKPVWPSRRLKYSNK